MGWNGSWGYNEARNIREGNGPAEGISVGAPPDGWYAEGRVPEPWRTITVGPCITPGAAGQAARDKHLGGITVYRVKDGRRVV